MTHPTSNTPDWITLSQAATRLGVHPATLRRWADEGEVPTLLTPGGHRRFRSADIDFFAEQHAQSPALSDRPKPEAGTNGAGQMTVMCFGTNHRCAPTDFREDMMRLAFELETAHASQALDPPGPIQEFAVLATCNRTEIYAVSPQHGDAAWVHTLTGELTKRHRLSVRELNDRCYTLDELHAIHHLYRVSCGLDSMVVGESEIAGQVAATLERATEHTTIGPVLTEIFHGAIRAGRRARAETSIGRGSASVSSVAVGLGREQLGNMEGRNVLVVGSGKMGRLAAEAFRGLAGATLTVANRTREHAQRVAAGCEQVIGLEDIGTALIEADLVLTSTSAPGTIIDRAMVETALRNRQSTNPIVFVDIAVPRDVDDTVRTLDHVLLFGIDDLQDRIDANLAERQAEVPRVDKIIDEELEALQVRRTESHVRPIISALRNRAEAIRRREVDRFLAKHGDAHGTSHDAIEQLTHSIVNKILHDPTVRLRRNAATYRNEEYEKIVRGLLALD